MNAKISAYIMILFLLNLFSFTYTQQKHKTEANADLVEYTNKEGLPTTNIANIVQTKDGYIWISGIEGTYRFNGYEFEEIREDIELPSMQNIYYDSAMNVLYFASPTKFISFNGKEFKVFTEENGYKLNGLSGQQISLFNADSKGRIWIGSETPFVDKYNNGGLTYFENEKFTAFDSTNYPLDNATGFIETPYGDLIFTSSGHNTQTQEGAYCALFKNGKFTRIDESMGVNLQGVNLLPGSLSNSIDKEGNTWIVFTGSRNRTNDLLENSGLVMYDGTEFYQQTGLREVLGKDRFPVQVYHSNNLDKLFLTTFTQSGEIFNGKNRVIYEYSNGKWQHSDILSDIGKINDLKTSNYIQDYRFAGAFFIKASKYFPELLILPSTNFTQSSTYPNQFFHYKDGKWEKFDSFNGGAAFDMNDAVIIPTGKGMGLYYPNYSKMLTSNDGLLLEQSGIPTLYTDDNGILWITYSYTEKPAYALTADVGINVWDGSNLRSLKEEDGLASSITFEVLQDSKKRLWIATAHGITMVREIKNSEGKIIFKLNNIPSENSEPYNTSSILETKKGEIYVWQNYVRPEQDKLIEAGYFLGKYDGEKFIKIKSPFSDEDMRKKYQIFDLREDNNGRLWFIGVFSDRIEEITSLRSNIMLYNGNSWEEPPENWNIPSEQLHYVGNLENGMYFLTVGGFYVFNGKSFIELSDSVDQNADFRILKGASVAGTKTDIQAGNHLYIRLRNRGLVIFDGTNLKFYTKKDGLPSTNLSNPMVDEIRGNVYFSSPSGVLKVTGNKFQTFYTDENIVSGGPYASAMDGFGNMIEYYNGLGLYINKSTEKSFPLKISSVAVNDNVYHYYYPAELAYTENSFLFNYAALNYKDPKQTTYEHFLEGYDKDWSRASTLNFAEYQNLPSGKYTFKVRGVTSNGAKTDEASFSFKVNPPFWKTWWAYLIYLGAFGLGLVGIRKYELDRRKENENKKFLQLENERKTKELEEARQLQLSMLPKQLPQLPHIDIAVYMKTATEVGGDYYDFHVHLDGTLTVILGDATGHGMMSGMMVSIMKSLFMSDRTNKQLKPFFENANEAIKDMQLGRLMMALTCVQIINNKIITSNAGMPPLYIYRRNTQSIDEVAMNNMPLGAMKEIEYDAKEIEIFRGDSLLLMSDGFAELKNTGNEFYGYKRARNSFEEAATREPEEIVNHLKEEAHRWTNGTEPDDDITFVVIKVK